MAKKLAFYLAPVLLVACATQQARVRKDEFEGAKTGTVQVMAEKNGIIRIGCAVGLD